MSILHNEYSKLGSNCVDQSRAIISNHKFLTQTNPIYCHRYQNMMQVPGYNSNFVYINGHMGDPNYVRTFLGKNPINDTYEQILNSNNRDDDIYDKNTIDTIVLRENKKETNGRCCGK